MLPPLVTTIPILTKIIAPCEEWKSKTPVKADHIRTSRGLYNHHGIYITDDEVIHFASDGDDNLLGTTNQIISTDLAAFLRGGDCEVKIYTDDELADLYQPHEIISFARASLGEDGYNVVFNNCEHFTNYCTLGRFHSHQISNIVNPLKINTGAKMIPLIPTLVTTLGGLLLGSMAKDKKRETVTTIYEPDKVRVAEIEAQTKMILAKAHIEEIKLKHELQKELMEHFVEIERAVIQARVEGFSKLTEEIIRFGNKMAVNLIEEHRLVTNLDEENKLKIENLYKTASENINEILESRLKTVVNLQDKMESTNKDSPAYKIYHNMMDQLATSIMENANKAMENLEEDKKMQISSIRESKKALTDILNNNSQSLLTLIDKSRELIGNTDTAKLLQNQNSGFLLGDIENAEQSAIDPLKIEQAQSVEDESNHVE